MKLDVPDSISEMFSEHSKMPVSQSKTDTDGRVRNYKHERGNWSGFVYIDCK